MENSAGLSLACLQAATQAFAADAQGWRHRAAQCLRRPLLRLARFGRRRQAVAATAAPLAATTPFRKLRRSLMSDLRFLASLRFFHFLGLVRQARFFATMAPAPAAAAPATAASTAAEPSVAPVPFSSTMRGYCSGGSMFFSFEGHVDRLLETDALLGAADARMAATDRPGTAAGIAKEDRRAVGVVSGLAAELVQAVALAVAVVAEFHREAAGIEVGAAFAVFVDQA